MTYLQQFPTDLHGLTPPRLARLSQQLAAGFQEELTKQQIETESGGLFERFYLPLAATLARTAAGRTSPPVIGINGAQGSGKTTLCHLLKRLLAEGFGLQAAVFSIDDLYLPRHERLNLARTVHPLLATRGVPGTHDVALGQELLDALIDRSPGRDVVIPTFDKARDDRAPRANWRTTRTPLDLVLFEGWCVGAQPQAEAALTATVNSLEREEDPQALWRHYVNGRLQGDYARLFARIDLLIMLEIPDMACVPAWRGLQERKLADRHGEERQFIMTETELGRFLMHYERLTRHMLEEMPHRADLVLRLGDDHQPAGLRCNFVTATKIDNRA